MSNFTPPNNWTTWESCDGPGDDVEVTETRRGILNIDDTTRRSSSKRAIEDPQYSYTLERNPPQVLGRNSPQALVHQMEAASSQLSGGPESRDPGTELSSTSLKRRLPRATQACRGCRAAKIKCDEMIRCANCVAKDIICQRDPIVQPQPIKTIAAQLDVSKRLDHLIESQEIFQRALVKAFPTFERELILERQLISDASREDNYARPLGNRSTGRCPETSPDIVNDQLMTDYAMGNLERDEAKELASGVKSKLGIPPDHTTGWVGVLQWQVVADIIGEVVREDNLTCDPLGSENKRELLTFNNYSSQNYGTASDLDYLTVKRHTESYLSYFGIMHPILDPKVIDNLVDEYWTALRDVKSIFTEPKCMLPWDPTQSINVAILLLVVALGQSCEQALDYRADPYEGSPDTESLGEIALENTLGMCKPMFWLGFIIDYRADPYEESPDTESLGEITLENTLGYTFFSAAITLLGCAVCGNTIQHVQAYVLAGLYYGQLTRILESHTYYSNASRVLYMILKPRLLHIQDLARRNQMFSREDDQLIIIFWTCLQLESDILAELDVPQSQILTWESTMPWPNVETAVGMGFDVKNMECYNALLWLRKRLNHIHSELYGPGIQDGYSLEQMNHLSKLPFIDSLRESLEGSNAIAPSWTWNPDDPPSQSIFAARLRGKYYGGLVITYRPFLKMILDNEFSARTPEGDQPDYISPMIMNHARSCIDSLIKSTQAFWNVPGVRPILTNRWGTAYAQYGNVLLLLAVYRNGRLRRFVDRNQLKDLATATLQFLGNEGNPSPALWEAHKILQFASVKVLG
ncbi:hypothetical protein V498_06293 [Pseudogymnoascus sp. VKM F-4517 (FW-2822)]|nr:hypothetical protein V498_06293 [Pseudogymnoascus sp. VKM F-4517 (FW-2822)]